jgi:enterochelin esterase-like enzyme
MAISRRTFVIGSVATVGVATVAVVGGGFLVEEGVLPGRSKLDQVLGACGDPGPIPTNEPGPIVEGSFVSRARNGATVGWTVIYPPGHAPGDSIPVCLALHGRGGNHADTVSGSGLDRFLAAAVHDGTVEPFAIASMDGGAAVNWHRRADGDDPATMITDEFLPLLNTQGLDVVRPASWGVSLGATGALYLATLDGVEWSRVVAASPALWKKPGEWQAGAYDDENDFASNNLWARRDLLDSSILRIDCGSDDPFADHVREFRNSLNPVPAGGIHPGCHDGAFWTRQAPAEIEFVGACLANSRSSH